MTIKVAEIGINHNGDVKIVKELISIAKSSGMDYVKLQKRTIDLVYSKEELDKPRESPWGTTTREQKEGLELSSEEYDEVDRYCKEVGIKWFASPWDIESVDFLLKYNPDYLKIPSALITYKDLLDKIKATNVPLVVSTGMSTPDEIDSVVTFFGDQIAYLLHTTASYPCDSGEINLSCITELKKKYPQYKIGFSNHSSGIIFCICAVALGAEMVEFHVTLDRAMYGSDQSASIGPQGIFRICSYIKHVKLGIGDGEKRVYDSEESVIKKLRRY